MGFFSKPQWTELSAKEFAKELKALKEMKQLTRLIGTDHADGVVTAFFNKFSLGGAKASYTTTAKKQYLEGLATLLQHEMNCVLTGHYYVGKLQVQAQMESFSNSFGTQVLAPADFGAKPSDSDLDKATAWIISSSTSLVKSADNPAAPVNRAKVRAALQTASGMDIRSEATLRWLHTQLVNQTGLRATRGPAKEAPYPSTGGAGFLLATTFDLAQGVALPANANPAWFDLSCFLFGAVVRSHGFTDGNGRVGRGAYAAAMLAGGLPFVALKPSAEKLIHGLDQVS